MHQEKYSLTWHTYSDHLRGMMKELMMNEDFSDVTLVTEDKKHIRANLNILSACSPVFKDILKKGKHSNQIMYLRGIQFSEMESVMQFIYLGEATFYEERMDEFLAVAKSLEIKELCNASPEKTNESGDEPLPSETNDEQNDEISFDPETSTENLEEQTVISEQIKMQAPKRRVDGVNGRHECDKCHKAYSSHWSLYTHKQSAHQGVKYACDQCDYQTTQQSHLTRHVQSKHEGVRYACDQCDHQASSQSNLTRHIQSKHEGTKYACDQCEYQTTTQSNLTLHIQSKHEGVRYVCDQCDYQATTQGHLNSHIRSKHEGVRYACDQCDYQATQRSDLTKHIKNMHK